MGTRFYIVDVGKLHIPWAEIFGNRRICARHGLVCASLLAKGPDSFNDAFGRK